MLMPRSLGAWQQGYRTVQNTGVLAEVGNWSEILMVHVVVGGPQGRSMAKVRASVSHFPVVMLKSSSAFGPMTWVNSFSKGYCHHPQDLCVWQPFEGCSVRPGNSYY